MGGRRMGPKQQTRPDIPLGPDQAYGEKAQGSHKAKQARHSRQKQKTSHDM
ncbi:small acid-soluble spore protein P [Halobacillus kuroshimensis]|uniref:Small acid-soluble spore protein P n=2 Tax=Halobacillus TaxID=45667 RepID=A0A845DT21_9BACI|nr:MULTISPECIES: small acid-soluble spore protein P [Halobacillus]MBN8236550.1 small acid-soluble spore protein P [Halobacillus kuroshimensis]MCA1022950.1 small acid-soluble spore protein P [Halobacillus litoralis]MYL19695.1 small acid-soluble spore protein P [Halobacillus litoralis]MYL28841.1 small acid-soluble spore protein P [Halobacillus halophilus]MYL37092.1 small acid-soluble spore protein P [Halobacillus litoralis]